MRELILLRHAHAVPAGAGQADLDRPLSPEGLAEAEAAGRWIKDNGWVPDCVLCSPSRRTRETLEAVLGEVGYIDQRIEPSIYEATPGGLIALADAHRDVGRLMLVGHNPGLERARGNRRQRPRAHGWRHGHQNAPRRAIPGSSATSLGIVSTATPPGGMPR